MRTAAFVLSALVGAGLAAGGPVPRITPIEHASVLLSYASPTFQLYSDPVDQKGEGLFDKLPPADLIVITHSHADHFQPSTIEKLWKDGTKLIGPADVAAALALVNKTVRAGTTVLANGQSATVAGFDVHAVPMYNTGPNPHHPEGKWNGYVIVRDGGSVYLSGDTSFIPPMRNNFGFPFRFDHAFLCMNLPYTMGVREAAEATLAFNPVVVTPYHYRNADRTLSNLTEYKSLVNANSSAIDVDIMNFYPHGPLGTFRPEEVVAAVAAAADAGLS